MFVYQISVESASFVLESVSRHMPLNFPIDDRCNEDVAFE